MKLTAGQNKAKTVTGKNLCVYAGAGSGKTQVLIERFLYLLNMGAGIDRILAMTFTEKAASEMRRRIIEHLLKEGREEERRKVELSYINTIHGFSARILRDRAFEAGIDPGFEIMDEAASLTIQGRILEKHIIDIYKTEDREITELVENSGPVKFKQNVLSLLNGAKTQNIKLAEFLDDPETGNLAKFAMEVDRIYETEKRRRGLLDYEDLQIKVLQLLENQKISDYYRDYFQHILVDEFQDTNCLQKSIIDFIRRKDNLFAVGDPGQSIYRFRNAEVKIFTDLREQTEREEKGEVIKLRENFRSCPEIIKFLNFFFGKLSPGQFLELKSTLPAGKFPQVETILVNQGQELLKDARITEAELIARRIKKLSGSFSYKDIVILFRSTSSITTYETALEANDIPYFTVSGRGFYSKRELANMLSLLRAVDNPLDNIALCSVLKSPIVGVRDDTLYWLSKRPFINSLDKLDSIEEIEGKDREKLVRFREFFSKLRNMREDRLSKLLEVIMNETNYDVKLLTQKNGYRRYSNIRKMHEIIRGFQKEPRFGLKDFLNYMDSLTVIKAKETEAQIEDENADVVRLMTIHKAKGLEFPVVIVADMGRESFSSSEPILFSAETGIAIKGSEEYKSMAEKNLEKGKEEENRILYVAMTRAGERLILSGISKFEEVKNKSTYKVKRWIDLVRKVIGIEEQPEKNSVIEVAKGLRIPVTCIPAEKQHAGREIKTKTHRRFIDYFKDQREILEKDLRDIAEEWNIDTERIAARQDEVLARTEGKPGIPEEDIISIGVTQLMQFANCPRRYHLKYNLAMPEVSGTREDEPGGAEFGSIAHRILERYDFSKTPGSQMPLLLENEPNLKKGERTKLEKIIGKFAQSDLAKELGNAEEIRKEEDFALKLNGSFVNGCIDCFYKTREGEWVLIDYKTDQHAEIQNYLIQIRSYALAVLKIKKTDSVRVVLYFLTPGQVYEETITQDEAGKIKGEMTHLISFIKKGLFEPKAGSWCKYCRYKKLCELRD